MDDLVQFLRSRLDEDEQMARACPGDGTWTTEGLKSYAAELSDQVRAHAARQDPARTLREVEAKRRVVEQYCTAERKRKEEGDLAQKSRASGWDPITAELEEASAIHKRDALHGALRLLAVPYPDHPDYRAEWRT